MDADAAERNWLIGRTAAAFGTQVRTCPLPDRTIKEEHFNSNKSQVNYGASQWICVHDVQTALNSCSSSATFRCPAASFLNFIDWCAHHSIAATMFYLKLFGSKLIWLTIGPHLKRVKTFWSRRHLAAGQFSSICGRTLRLIFKNSKEKL